MSSDSIGGAAKWAAVGALGTASIFGIAWSMVRTAPASSIVAPPAPIQSIAPAHAAFAQPEALSAPVLAPPEPSAPEPAPTAARTAARTIDINTAPSAELELLPGVGPVMAAKIIEYRTKNGPFRSVDDLDEVKGIGPKTLEKLRPLVRVQ